MHVVITAHPKYSHVIPLALPVADLLRRAGHEVTIATGADFAARLASDGYSTLALPSARPISQVMFDANLLGDSVPGSAPGDRPDRVPAAPPPEMFARGFVKVMGASFAADLLDALASDPPDLILRDPVEFGGYLAAERLGIAHGVLDNCPLAPFGHPAVLEELNRQREALGLPPMPDAWHPLSTFRAGVVPEVFYPPANRLPNARYYRTPPQSGQAPLDGAIAALPSDRPLVLASIGTNAHRVVESAESVLNTVIEVLGQLPVTGVVAVGEGRDPSQWSGARADNVHLTSFVQQRLLLPACAAFITHAGFNSVREGIEAGAPMVALPLFAEEPANARRIAELGLGPGLSPEELTAATLRNAVEHVLSDEKPRARVKWLQRQMFALPPLSQIVEDVQSLKEVTHARAH
ncbi:MAG TPA: glycosyltransferase [Trebonia sp.]|nr:glycosyltransferase [Trebonia sp.]